MRINSIRVFVLGALIACCLTHPLHLKETFDEDNLENGQIDLMTLLSNEIDSNSEQSFPELDEWIDHDQEDYQGSLPEIPLRQGGDYWNQDDSDAEYFCEVDDYDLTDKGNNSNDNTSAQSVQDEDRAGVITEADSPEEEEVDNNERNGKELRNSDIWMKVMIEEKNESLISGGISELKPNKSDYCPCRDPDIVAPLGYVIDILRNLLKLSKNREDNIRTVESEVWMRIKVSDEEKELLKKFEVGTNADITRTNLSKDLKTNEGKCECLKHFLSSSIQQSIHILQSVLTKMNENNQDDNESTSKSRIEVPNEDTTIAGWASTEPFSQVEDDSQSTTKSRIEVPNEDTTVVGWASTEPFSQVKDDSPSTSKSRIEVPNEDTTIAGWASTSQVEEDTTIAGWASTSQVEDDSPSTSKSRIEVPNEDTTIAGWATTEPFSQVEDDSQSTSKSRIEVPNEDTTVAGWASTEPFSQVEDDSQSTSKSWIEVPNDDTTSTVPIINPSTELSFTTPAPPKGPGPEYVYLLLLIPVVLVIVGGVYVKKRKDSGLERKYL